MVVIIFSIEETVPLPSKKKDTRGSNRRPETRLLDENNEILSDIRNEKIIWFCGRNKIVIHIVQNFTMQGPWRHASNVLTQ